MLGHKIFVSLQLKSIVECANEMNDIFPQLSAANFSKLD